jgi:hypothetical protein
MDVSEWRPRIAGSPGNARRKVGGVGQRPELAFNGPESLECHKQSGGYRQSVSLSSPSADLGAFYDSTPKRGCSGSSADLA